MSAYICDNKTISAIAKAFDVYGVPYKADNYKDTNPFGALGGVIMDIDALRHDIGQSLLDQNFRSVNERYGEEDETPAFIFEDVDINEGIIKGCIDCYNYQACETDDYFDSDIYKSLKSLEAKLLQLLISKCGYSTSWGYPED